MFSASKEDDHVQNHYKPVRGAREAAALAPLAGGSYVGAATGLVLKVVLTSDWNTTAAGGRAGGRLFYLRSDSHFKTAASSRSCSPSALAAAKTWDAASPSGPENPAEVAACTARRVSFSSRVMWARGA